MDRLFSVAKINTILQGYKKNDFNELDKKLIRGIFNRKTTEVDFMSRVKPGKAQKIKTKPGEPEYRSDSEVVRSKNNNSSNRLFATASKDAVIAKAIEKRLKQ
jgi:hypothetical protein